MADSRGNPDFGTKYKFNYGRDKPLSKQVSTRIAEETKQELEKIAESKNCSVPDLIRIAIDSYLAADPSKETVQQELSDAV